MRKLYNYRYESLAILLAVAALIMGFYLKLAYSDQQMYRSALFAFFVADCAALCFTIRKLWRNKWRRVFVGVVQRIVAKLAGPLIKFIERRLKVKKGTVLSGKISISFDMPWQDTQKPQVRKTLKWKKLNDNRERLGYLYKHMIEKRIKRGSIIRSYNTPCEIRVQEDNEVFEERIFQLYIENRYRETVDTDTETLDELKGELG